MYGDWSALWNKWQHLYILYVGCIGDTLHTDNSFHWLWLKEMRLTLLPSTKKTQFHFISVRVSNLRCQSNHEWKMKNMAPTWLPCAFPDERIISLANIQHCKSGAEWFIWGVWQWKVSVFFFFFTSDELLVTWIPWFAKGKVSAQIWQL